MEGGDLPPLVDDPRAPEVFAAFPVGVSMIGPIVTLTFEAPRIDYSVQPNELRRQVVLRLTTSVGGAQSLVLKLNAYLEAQGLSPSRVLTQNQVAQ